MNAVVSCSKCEWNSAANPGDLVVSETDSEGRCLEHRVVHL